MNRAVHLTFGELLDWHQEQFGRHHRSDAMRQFADKHLRPAFGTLPLVDVPAGRIDQLLTERSVDLAPKSINHLRSIVHTPFSRAIQRELWRGANPAKGVKLHACHGGPRVAERRGARADSRSGCPFRGLGEDVDVGQPTPSGERGWL